MEPTHLRDYRIAYNERVAREKGIPSGRKGKVEGRVPLTSKAKYVPAEESFLQQAERLKQGIAKAPKKRVIADIGLRNKVNTLRETKQDMLNKFRSSGMSVREYLKKYVMKREPTWGERPSYEQEFGDWLRTGAERRGFRERIDPLNRHHVDANTRKELIDLMERDIGRIDKLQSELKLHKGEYVDIHEIAVDLGLTEPYTPEELKSSMGKTVVRGAKGELQPLYKHIPEEGGLQHPLGPSYIKSGTGRKFFVKIENPAGPSDVAKITGGEGITWENAAKVKKGLQAKGFDGYIDADSHIPFGREGHAVIPSEKALTENRYQEAGPETPEAASGEPVERGLGPLEGAFDRVKKLSPKLGNAFREQKVLEDKYRGWGTDTIDRLEKGKFSKETLETVRDAMHEADAKGVDTRTLLDTPEEEKAFNIIKDYFHDQLGNERRRIGMKIAGRQPGMNESYFPQELDKNVLETFRTDPNGPNASKYREDWAKHIFEQSRLKSDAPLSMDEAYKVVDDFVDALGEESTHYLSAHFGAMRKPEGFGLPENLREQDVIRSIGRYSNRAARDLSMFKALENPDDIRTMLNMQHPNKGGKRNVEGVPNLSRYQQVREAMAMVTGRTSAQEAARKAPLVSALTRMFNAGIMGPLSIARDVGTIPANMAPYIERMSDIGAIGRGLANMRNMSRRAMRVGATTRMANREFLGDLEGNSNKLIAGINKVADWARVGQGREAGERLGREALFSIGTELGRNNIAAAKAGEAGAKAWLKKFSTGIDGDITNMHGQMLEDALDLVGKNFTDRNQGSYSGAELPFKMLDSQFAPFFALRKWGVEKANVIKKDVIDPAARGNLKPLLLYGLSTTLTGAAIEKISSMITGKKAQEPSLGEVIASGSAKDYAAKLVGLMQMGSAGGALGDAAHIGMNMGVYGKMPQNQLSMPMVTGISDAVTRANNALEGAKAGDDTVQIGMQLIADIMKSNIQTARIVAGHGEEAERQNKFRDVRVHKMLQGEPVGSFAAANPYLDMDIKKWKKETNPVRAATQLQNIIQRRISQGMPMDELKKELRGMKSMTYQTMPNPRTDPQGFRDYYNHLVRSQGKEEADARVSDFMIQNTLNKYKIKAVPRTSSSSRAQ